MGASSRGRSGLTFRQDEVRKQPGTHSRARRNEANLRVGDRAARPPIHRSPTHSLTSGLQIASVEW
jgi:hypothetical protein